MQRGRASTSGLGVPPLLLARWVGWVAPVGPTHGVLVLSRPSAALRVHVCTVSWATWLLLTGEPARCVVLRVRCPGPLGSCSPVCTPGVLCRMLHVLGHLAPVQRSARSVRCLACGVSWATWLLLTDVPTRCVVLRVPCPGPLGFCSRVCPLGALCCVCGVLGHLAHVYRCARSVRCVPCAVSWATWLLFTGVHTRCVVSRARCPGPLGSCSAVCPLGALPCLCSVLGHLAPVHQCARWVCCVACAVSWATWLLFTGVLALCVVLHVRCPGPVGSCSLVRPLCVFCCVCRVLGHLAPVHRCARMVCSVCSVCSVLGLLAPVHRCARSVRCIAYAMSWATWLLFTGVPARCVALRVRCPGPLDSRSPVCSLGVVCRVFGVHGHLTLVHRCACMVCVVCSVCGVLGHLAPVHQCARSVRCISCALSWATWLLFTAVPAQCVVLRVRCPWPVGSCLPVCPLTALPCLCGVFGHLAPVHRCARSVCCVARAVSWATWLLFNGVPARCAVWRVRCPRPLDSCSPVCPLGALCCLGVSWGTWLLFTGVPALCVVLLVRCSGPLGSCSPVSPLGALRCLCGVLGHLASVHRCACSVCCVARAVSWASWLPFTRVPAACVALPVRCPGPLGSCSPVCPLGVLCCACNVLGHLAPVQACARSVRCVACAVFWATWLLFTGAHGRRVLLRVRCPGPLGSCSTVRPLGALCCVCGVLGHLAPVHRCGRSVCCAVCCVCGALLRGAHSCIRTAAFRSQQELSTLRARTRPSGWRLFRSRQGLGTLQGVDTSIWTAVGVAWHPFWCYGNANQNQHGHSWVHTPKTSI